LGEVAEGQEAGEGHGEAGEHGDKGRVVCYAGEAVDGGFAEGAVDQEGVVVCIGLGGGVRCAVLENEVSSWRDVVDYTYDRRKRTR